MSDSADLHDVLARPALQVAPVLLGALLSANGVTLRLTEVEAYEGADDPGSHAFRGRTARNAVMFGPPGRVYVYFTYGMHHCANIVCGPEGLASAVLLRAGEVVGGGAVARERRPGVAERDLARGPARLCRALAWVLDDNGTVVTDVGRTGAPVLRLPPPGSHAVGSSAVGSGVAGSSAADTIRTGPRVGLRAAAERPWRFWLAGEPCVSDYRPAKRLPG